LASQEPLALLELLAPQVWLEILGMTVPLVRLELLVSPEQQALPELRAVMVLLGLLA
jgi:hypothetical protein